jgi:hypothetical protein
MSGSGEADAGGGPGGGAVVEGCSGAPPAPHGEKSADAAGGGRRPEGGEGAERHKKSADAGGEGFGRPARPARAGKNRQMLPGSPEQERRGLCSGRTMRSAHRKGIERSGSTSGPRRSAARARKTG